MARDLLERLIGGSLLIDEGLNFATYGLLRNLDINHLEVNPAIRMGVDDGRGRISGFETIRDYAGPQYHGRIILGEELREYFVHRNQARKIIPYVLSETLLKDLSENERKRIKDIFK